MSFPDLIRTGSEQGLLLGDWPTWKAYRTARAKTSHTYDEQVALEVATVAARFLEEVRFLLAELKSRS